MRFQPHLRAAVFALLLFAPLHARPQGCTQCRDNTAATPPATQRAFRHAILLLTVAGSGLFLATLYIVRHHR